MAVAYLARLDQVSMKIYVKQRTVNKNHRFLFFFVFFAVYDMPRGGYIFILVFQIQTKDYILTPSLTFSRRTIIIKCLLAISPAWPTIFSANLMHVKL